MTDARETIADALHDTHDKYGRSFYHMSDAIIAALPDIVGAMVKPLEWDDDGNNEHHTASLLGEYSIYLCGEFGWLVQLNGHDDSWVKYPSADHGFLSLAAAKQSANDHNRAQVLGALGL